MQFKKAFYSANLTFTQALPEFHSVSPSTFQSFWCLDVIRVEIDILPLSLLNLELIKIDAIENAHIDGLQPDLPFWIVQLVKHRNTASGAEAVTGELGPEVVAGQMLFTLNTDGFRAWI